MPAFAISGMMKQVRFACIRLQPHFVIGGFLCLGFRFGVGLGVGLAVRVRH